MQPSISHFRATFFPSSIFGTTLLLADSSPSPPLGSAEQTSCSSAVSFPSGVGLTVPDVIPPCAQCWRENLIIADLINGKEARDSNMNITTRGSRHKSRGPYKRHNGKLPADGTLRQFVAHRNLQRNQSRTSQSESSVDSIKQ